MTVCKFYLKGYCRFGDRCRFEHIEGGATGQEYANNPLKWVNPNLQQSPASTFSFTKAAQSLSEHASNFSFNRAANQFGQQQQPTGFGNSLFGNQVRSSSHGTSSFFANQPQQQQHSMGVGAASGFSFTQAFKQIHPQPQQRGVLVTYDDVMDEEMNPPTANNNMFSNVQAPAAKSSFFSRQPTSAGSFSFGGSANASSGPMSSQFVSSIQSANITPTFSSALYTELDQLSDEDRVLFEADRFIDRIPLCPPPRQLCMSTSIRSH